MCACARARARVRVCMRMCMCMCIHMRVLKALCNQQKHLDSGQCLNDACSYLIVHKQDNNYYVHHTLVTDTSLDESMIVI